MWADNEVGREVATANNGRATLSEEWYEIWNLKDEIGKKISHPEDKCIRLQVGFKGWKDSKIAT